jgi:hypothetical protein
MPKTILVQFCPSCFAFTPKKKDNTHKGSFNFVTQRCKACAERCAPIDPAKMEEFFHKPTISHQDLLDKYLK